MTVDELLRGGKNHYQVLGVAPFAPGAEDAVRELKKCYLKLSRLVHPDKCTHPRSTEAFQLVQA
eukprot:5405468-Prymnesium_polylepis.1